MPVVRKYPNQEDREWLPVPSQVATTLVTVAHLLQACVQTWAHWGHYCVVLSHCRPWLPTAIRCSHRVLHHPALWPPSHMRFIGGPVTARSLSFLCPVASSPSPKIKARTKSLGHALPGPLHVSDDRPSSPVQVLQKPYAAPMLWHGAHGSFSFTDLLLYSRSAAKYILNGWLSNRGHFWKWLEAPDLVHFLGPL